jgi:hypothetical protein
MTDEFDGDNSDQRIPPRARPSDPSTSHKAIPDGKRLGALQRIYLKILAESHRPLAPFEVEEISGHFGLWRRNSELKYKGMSEEAGETFNPETRRTCKTHRPTGYGRLISKR